MIPASPLHQQLLVMPDDGPAAVIGLMDEACEQLLLKQFRLESEAVEQALRRARERGVIVRVMLNRHTSGGERWNDEAFVRLEGLGIEVAWSSEAFPVTHEQSMVIDRQAALICSFPMAERYFSQTRDYGVLTRDPAVVAQVIAGFEADWNRTFFAPDLAVGLVWSSFHSRGQMAGMIDRATRTLWIQHPRFVDAVILERIIQACDRGVKVRVLCAGRHGLRDGNLHETLASLRIMSRFGAKVRQQSQPILHAKLVLVDGAHAQIGSLEIDRSAFDLHRELGIESDAADVVGRLRDTFRTDWRQAQKWSVPDPLDPGCDEKDEPLPDPPLLHH